MNLRTSLLLASLFASTSTLAAPQAAGAAPAAPKAGKAASAPPELKTEDQKTLYALGLSMGRSIAVFNLTPAELDIVKAGLTAQVRGEKPAVELDTYGPKLQQLAMQRQSAIATAEKQKGKAFEEKAAKEKGAQKLESGVIYQELKKGTGASPKATDTVKVHYRGTLLNGTEFDSSYKRGEPATFPLNGVIPCWTQGVQKMKVGGKAKLVCPADTAYGDRGAPPNIPGGSTLVFEVELVDIPAGAAQPPAPPAQGK